MFVREEKRTRSKVGYSMSGWMPLIKANEHIIVVEG